MKCDCVAPLLMPLVDRELGPLHAFRAARHVATCPHCAAEHRALAASRDALRRELPRHRAPTDLVASLTARFGDAPAPRPDRAERTRWWTTGAVAGAAATVALWVAASTAFDWLAAADTALRLVDAHTTAVLAGTQVAVASSDHHTVKPWLSARLDYSPPVDDLASAGFPLAGARIDVVDGRRVAILVYRYRDHTIDVFVRPEGTAPIVAAGRTIRGFNVVAARGRAMDWTAVSDANTPTIAALLARLAASS